MKNSKKTAKPTSHKNRKSSHSKKSRQSEQRYISPPSSRSVSKRQSQKSKSKPKQPPPKQKAAKKVQAAQSGNEQERSNFLPGQKYKTPEEESGALAFYKSLYEQNPNSQMARRYCVEYGVLEQGEARRVLQSLSRQKCKNDR